jgi:hypothetical protein
MRRGHAKKNWCGDASGTQIGASASPAEFREKLKASGITSCIRQRTDACISNAEATMSEQSLLDMPRVGFNPEEAAASVGIARTRIFEAIRKRELQARKAGRRTIIEPAELLRWVRTLPIRGRS